jgi:hypothetical protein
VTISGFMIVRNVASQGYPFLEAALAALPVCDEFLISDGESSDATWKALEALRDKHPDKVKLFRDSWGGDASRGAVLARMTNALRRRCAGEY